MDARRDPAVSWWRDRDDLSERIGSEEVAMLFRIVRLAVGAALAAAISEAFVLVRFRSLDLGIAAAWCFYIALCAVAHAGLGMAYDRAATRSSQWRRWGHAFTLICLAEGAGWGWGSVMLARHDGLDAKFLALVVTQAIAAGSIPTFGRYLPAFLALFLPTTLPYAVNSLLSSDSLERGSGLLMVLYVLAMGIIGAMTNRQYREVTRLRMQTDRFVVELSRQKTIAEEANHAKSTFLAAASHDLRQPVHALGLFVGALRTIDMPAEALRLVEQIDLSTQAMDSLFAALLDISRLDAGVVEVRKRIFAIDSVLSRIAVEYAAEAAAKALSLRHLRSTASVASDPILIERVLRNLVANAVRYTETGRILIGCRRRGPSLVIQVWDTGPGIPADQRERVFQEYYQLGNAERDRTKGLGLGLAIVRRLTQLLDVPVRVRSIPRQGSCFEIDLPRATPSNAALASRETSDELAPLEGRLIVVIDDEAPIRTAMFSVLTGWGHDVVVAASGDEAIAMLASLPLRPDLIICDLRLRGGETGTTVIEMLRTEYNESIPAILVTGDTAPDRLAEARASGLLVLHKPVSNGRLRAALANVIAQAEAVVYEP